MDIFKKPPSPEDKPQVGFQGPPTDKVIQMKRQGLTNNQIIQALQNDGYNSTDVFDALNQADLKGGVEMSPRNNFQQQSGAGSGGMQDGSGQGAPQQFQGQMPMSDGQQQPDFGGMPGVPGGLGSPGDFGAPGSMGGMGSSGGSGGFAGPGGSGKSADLERIEELAEAIIDEKWNEIVKSINKIADWKDRTESKITKMEQNFENLQKGFDQLHQGVIGKIGEYDKNLVNISAEIKAMDKVFQKVLPVMTENVNELSRITQDMKKR
ncbi:MAG: hypothetical protein ABIG89_00320 [Candidatus Woesearchaeota archaeon]